ncbi:MAG: 8-oxo-dGTP diphosphatase [Chloroflexota bacterium]
MQADEARALRQATLCLLLRGEPPAEVLLGYKKVGFGQGRYTGFGGKLEAGEILAQAAQREMLEESGVSVALADLDYAAQLDFIFPFRPGWSQSVHVFLARAWSGEPQESDEMRPRWFEVAQIPYDQMWADGRHWLPPLLAGRRIWGRFVFEQDNQGLAEVEIQDRSPYDRG